MRARIWIPVRLPSLNEYTRDNRAHWARGAKSKGGADGMASWHIRAARPPHFHGPVDVSFRWVEPDRRRDPDNIVFAKKFVLDALVSQRVIRGDGWRWVASLSDTWDVGEEPGVMVTIKEAS